MKLTVIGYYGGSPKEGEGTSAYLVSHEGFHLLLDCGSAAVSLMQKVVDLDTVHHVVLSHFHHDHICDGGIFLYNRLVRMQLGEVKEPLHFYGLPVEEEKKKLIWEPYADYQDIGPGESLQIGPFALQFLQTKHPIECLAMRITCDEKSLVYTADTALFPELVEFAEDADLLLAECSLYKEYDGESSGHMNALDVAKLGEESGAKHLVLTHLPIYGNPEELLQDGKKMYSGKIQLAERFLTLKI